MNRLLWIVALALPLALACKSKNDVSGLDCGVGPADASCHFADGCIDIVCPNLEDGICYSLDKHKYFDQMGCEKRNGRFVEKCACPHKGAIGGCRKNDDGHLETTWLYSGMTPEQYQNLCESNVNNTFVTP